MLSMTNKNVFLVPAICIYLEAHAMLIETIKIKIEELHHYSVILGVSTCHLFPVDVYLQAALFSQPAL